MKALNKALTIFLALVLLFLPIFAHSEDAELNAEIQKGKEIVEKFFRNEISCKDLSNEDFHAVGEYVMEQMIGGSDHLLMNKMMEQMHGKEVEELMHINMGKRFLGCDGSFFVPMHQSFYYSFYNTLYTIFLILAIIFLSLGIFYFFKKLSNGKSISKRK
ncbi:MAG: hypothetical protein QW367_02945 [Candidatus Aenigmatarchaeota archaeon]